MAKAKQQEFSIEEKLEQALVPKVEQPYDIPSNWVWTKLGNICQLTNGEKQQGVDLPYLEAKVLRGKVEASSKNEGVFISKGSKVILVDGENSGEVFNIDIDGYMGSTFKLLNIANPIIDDFIEYFISIYKDDFKNSKIGSAIPHLNKDLFYNLAFPLPSFDEQQRIVDRIESLFEKLDNAKELAQNVLDSFEIRKAAILHKAFTGELTAEWREKNGVDFERDWKRKKLGDLIMGGPQNGLYKPQSAYGSGNLIVRIDNFYDGKINPWYTLKRLNLERNEIDLYSLNNNDILINRVNSIQYLGKSALVRDLEETCVFESNVMRLKLNDEAVPEYIIKYLNSSSGLYELRKNAKHAVNQASINQQDVKSVLVPLPPVKEQKEIIHILGYLIENEQKAKELCDVVDKIDLMKKVILARAFRGKLGTNDLSEESAIELLKECLL